MARHSNIPLADDIQQQIKEMSKTMRSVDICKQLDLSPYAVWKYSHDKKVKEPEFFDVEKYAKETFAL